MADPAQHFFKQLTERRRIPLLAGVSGTVLLEAKDGEQTDRWYVVIRRGELDVEKRGADADCVVRTDRATLHAIILGETNAMAAVLRGKVEVEGRVSLLVALQSLFKPSAGADDQRVAGYARRSS